MIKDLNTNSQGDFEKDNCCGGPALTETDACCAADEQAKATGQDGCGCDLKSNAEIAVPSSCC